MEKKEILCEIIGIILGDGYLRYDTDNYKYGFNISLNGIDDYDYYQYVKKLLSEFFQKKLSEYWYRDLKNAQGDEKGVTISLYDKEIIKMLLEKGLIPGDKVKSGVCVPDWIKLKESYILKCLKGLIDTDGYIGAVKTNNFKFAKIIITFTSRSKNLVRDFKQLAELVRIRCSTVHGPYETFDKRTKKKYKIYSVSITAKDQVQMFIRIVNPKKWEYNKEIIGMVLNLYKNPLIFESIKKGLTDKFGKLNFFTKDQQIFLRNQLKSKNINISTQDIEDAINAAFSYNRIHYTYHFAEEIKDKLISLGSLREVEEYYSSKKEGHLNVYRKSIIQYLEKLFTQELKYKNLYKGLDGFRRWKSFNFDILVKKHNNKVSIYRFPFFLKKKLCNRINQIIGLTKKKDLVYSELKFIIENEDLNGNIITDKNTFYVKKYERIAFLLNDPKYKSAIQARIILLIEVVNEFKSLSRKGITMKIGELSYYLREKFNLNWKPENLKKILDELNLFEQLISKDDLNGAIITTPSFKKEEGEKSQKYDKNISSSKNNTFSKSNSSEPLPNNKPREEKLNDEDFSDPYLWFSAQVREAIRSKAESLIDQVHEGVSAPESFSDPWDKVSNYDSSEVESTSAEDLMDDPEEDIIPDQDIEPDSEDSEAQEGEDAHGTEITGSDEEIEDLISEQEELTEDQISDLEQMNDSDDREGDIEPDKVDPITQPDYDPLPQPITELIPPPEPSTNPEDISTPGQEKGTETPNSPQTQQEQEESSQVPEKAQDELGTEQNIEEISNEPAVQDIDKTINDDVEHIQNPDLGDSGQEDLPDDHDINPEEADNVNQDENADNIEEEKEEIEDKEEQAQDEKNEEDNKDESEDEMDREKDDDIDNLPEEIGDESQEGDHESDSDSQEGNPDDMDDFEDDSEIQLTPEQIINIMIGLAGQQVYPENHSMQSSNLDPSRGDVIIIDEGDLRELIRDIQIGDDDLKEKETTEVPSLDDDGAPDDLPDDEIKDDNFDNDLGDFL